MNKIISILIATLFLISSCKTVAQSKFYDTKSKRAIELYKKGYKSYKEYRVTGKVSKLKDAEKQVKKAIKKDPNFTTAYLLMGELELEKGDINRAIEYKEEALTINPEYSKNEYYFLAQLEMSAGKYKLCKKNAQKFLTLKNTNEQFQYNCKQYIKNCEFAIEALNKPVDFNPINLGPAINTDRPEYFPSITGDGKTILYTRLVKNKNTPVQGGEQEDLYIGKINKEDEWEVSEKFSSSINTLLNEGAPTLTADGNFVIFTSCQGMNGYGRNRTGKGSCDLFYAKRIGNKWSRPRNLGAPINTANWESQPCFSADGRTLYFIRARKNRGRPIPNDQDIYVTKLDEEGYWSTPKRLPPAINTPQREESVFIHPDGQTLYFGSNGHTGMGGMDLFVSRLQENGEWGKAENLGYPINTSGNENSIIVSPDGKLAYFASDREGGYGSLDLYSFELHEKAKPFYTTYMKGKVYDSKSKLPLGSIISVIDLKTGKVLLETFSDKFTGKYLVNIPTNKDLAINVSKNGYFFYSKNFSLNSSKEPLFLDIPLDKIKVSDKTFVLENVFFDVNKFKLKPESRIELDKLYDFLLLNKSLKIEIGGHTDSDGNKDKNQVLSQKRAESVVNYLIEKGISKERLTYKGYGQTVPRKENTTEENKATNRRTEIKITSK